MSQKIKCLTCGEEFIKNRKQVYCCKECHYQKYKKDWFEGYEDVMEKDDLAKNSYAIDPDITNAYDELNKTLHMGRYYKRKT